MTGNDLLEIIASTISISKEQALKIPAVSSCIDFITGIISGLPINLYQRTDDNKVKLITDDVRVKLLNGNTGDTLDSFQMRKAFITDYLLNGRGTIYINQNYGKIQSLNYVDYNAITVINNNTDPILKHYDISVNGAKYRDFQFIKLVRNTKNGIDGKGIIDEFKDILSIIYYMYQMQNRLYQTNGIKGGFVNFPEVQDAKADAENLKKLKEGLQALQNGDCTIIRMDKETKFTPIQNTSEELNFNDTKNSITDDICKMFNLNPDVISGKATEEQIQAAIKVAVMPILQAFEIALNKDLLLTSEQMQNYYFAFDTSELLRASIDKRYAAYNLAIKGGWMMLNEAREKEDLEALNGLDVICGSLGNVYINPKTGEIYTPNTNTTNNTISKGGELNVKS